MSERRLLFAMSRVAPSTHCSKPKPERMCGLQESADCPTKDDDIGFSSWNVKGSTEKNKRTETDLK